MYQSYVHFYMVGVQLDKVYQQYVGTSIYDPWQMVLKFKH